MVTQSTLLQIIQFVGLITPALAILIELLIRFHGGLNQIASNRNLPVEIQILFIGFGGILLGGMVVGIQMALTLSNQITQIATLFIFGSLPFLAVSVVVMNLRISGTMSGTGNTMNDLINSIRYALSILIPLILSIVLYFGALREIKGVINSNTAWWIFQNGIDPHWYFYTAAALAVYKVEYSLWSHDIIPTEDYTGVLENWFISAFTAGAFIALLVTPVFLAYFLLLYFNVPLISGSSIISSVPFLWGTVVVLGMLYVDLDPRND